jgi:predicted pyridoxine 5'-phosphate oxidase superfamily flavin-nucleotide-binding protein
MGQIIDGRRNGISASQPAKPAEQVPPPRPFEGDLGAWHEGERAAQARVGMAARMLEVGQRALRSFMTEQHRAFFAGLPFLVIGSVDAQGRPWASILFNRPGFATSTDPVTLNVAALPDPSDPLSSVLAEGTALGLLGIELPTLRRNRLNGHVRRVEAHGFSVGVDQSFGNCPQYIHRRDYAGLSVDALASPLRAERFDKLDSAAAALIARADTCFVASAAIPRGRRSDGIDVSHRGGMPGFLKLDDEARICLPDYRGNFFFNTLGNLTVNPRIGLTIVDFESGDLLQLTGTAEIIWEGAAVAEHPGAQRLCRITPLGGQWLRGGFPLRTALAQMSPQAIATRELPVA